MTPGAAGQAELDRGAKLAAGLPDAERLSIEGAAAYRHQDTGTYVADVKRVADLAPDDPHAQQALAWSLVNQRDFPGATAAFKKVLDLNPNASFAYLGLTFIHTQLREYDDALASAKKAVDVAPSDAGAPGRWPSHSLVSTVRRTPRESSRRRSISRRNHAGRSTTSRR